jgi:thioredoxin 1
MYSFRKILLLAFLFVGFQTYSQEKISFFNGSLQDALNEARTYKKPIMIDFSASWCKPCRKLDQETFSDVDVAVFVNNEYVAVRVDVDTFTGMDIAEKYQVGVYPTVIFLDSRGRYVTRMKGFYPPTYFLKAAEKFADMKGTKTISEDEDHSVLSSL